MASLLERLSEELQLHSFSFLPLQDLGSLLKVNRALSRLHNNNELWKSACRVAFNLSGERAVAPSDPAVRAP
jgi:hypothetical protein